MHLHPRRLPIGDVFAIGWKPLQFSRRGKQRSWQDLTNDEHVEQTIVDARAGSELDAAASLAAISDDCHRPGASNFAVRKDQLALILMNVDRQNCTHHSVSSRSKQAFEFR